MIKISKRDNRGLEEKARKDIEHIKAALKKEPIVQKEFKKYERDIGDVDNVSIEFDPNLDVSAKTVDGKIYLNAKMLEEDWQDYFHYAVHEVTHYLQHTSGNCNHDQDKKKYLDNENEIEAFQNQLKYREKTEDKSQVNKYIKELFDKHKIPKKDRPEKKKELLDE